MAAVWTINASDVIAGDILTTMGNHDLSPLERSRHLVTEAENDPATGERVIVLARDGMPRRFAQDARLRVIIGL